jgi:toxin ParE1/3/4
VSGYKISSAAKADLRQIWTFTNQSWGRTQADHYLHGVFEALNVLARNPKLGKDRHEVKTDFRSYLHVRHTLWYKINRDQIILMRVLHSAMDSRRHL